MPGHGSDHQCQPAAWQALNFLRNLAGTLMSYATVATGISRESCDCRQYVYKSKETKSRFKKGATGT